MSQIHNMHFTEPQMHKLVAGGDITVTPRHFIANATRIPVPVEVANKVMNQKIAEGKSFVFNLNRHAVNGGSIGSWFRNLGHSISSGFQKAAPVLKKIAKPFLSAGLTALGTAGATALGAPELAPLVGVVSSELSNHILGSGLRKKIFAGEVVNKSNRRRGGRRGSVVIGGSMLPL